MKILFAASILIVAFVAAFTLYLFFKTPATTATTTLTANEIAIDSLNFLVEMKRTGGRYNYSMNCTDGIGCVSNGDSYTQTGAWAVLAYAGLYQSTSDSQYLQKMNREAIDLINSCSGREDECMWVLTQIIRAYQVSKNPTYLNFAQTLGDRLIANGNKSQTLDTMIAGIEARELALLYEQTNDQKYLNEARVRLERSKSDWGNLQIDPFNEAVYSSSSFTLYRASCWTELGEAEIAKAANDSQARSNVIDFFANANITGNWRSLAQLTAIQPCIETLLNLYQQTGDTQYFGQAKAGMQYIITYRWDSPLQIATKYSGDGGFLFRLYTGDDEKTTTDTAYMIYLLSQMPNENFAILSWK